MRNLTELAIPPSFPAYKSVETKHAPRHKHGEPFLCGPIPLNWITHAANAAGRGSGLAVALALWYLSGLNKHAATVRLNGSTLRLFGLKRHASYRGLRALEAANLVKVKRHDGRNPIVTLLQFSEATS